MPDVLCETRNNKKPCLFSIISFHLIQAMPGAETLTPTLSSIHQSLTPELFPFIKRAIKIVPPNLIWDRSLNTLQRQAG